MAGSNDLARLRQRLAVPRKARGAGGRGSIKGKDYHAGRLGDAGKDGK